MATDQNTVIVGVGGGGCRIVEIMLKRRARPSRYWLVNADLRTLQRSCVESRVYLEPGIEHPSWNMQTAAKSARAAAHALSAVFRAAPLCCVISTLGGNTGSGASPVVARLARDMQLRCLTIATTPFAWESEQRHRNARAALSMLEQQAAQVDLIRLDDHMSGNEHEPFDAILDRVTAAAMKRIDAAAPPA